MLLLQSISAAQTNPPQETDSRSRTTSASLSSATNSPLNAYHEGSIPEISSAGNRYSLEGQIERIEQTQQEINTVLPLAPEYKVDTSEFHEIKERLAELENRNKAAKNHSGDGPHLRSASPTVDSGQK